MFEGASVFKMNSHKDNTPPGGKEEYMEPLLKYRGGKRREIPNFRNLIPQNYTTYIEPFFGGGAVFFDQEPVQSIINDINHPLINFYQQVANNYPQLMQELTELHVLYEQNETEYARQKTLHPEARVPNNNEPLYYQLRDMYNGLTPSTYLDGTLYYFINKTAYSGMIRYNAQGQYNVPFGRYKHFRVNNILPQHSTLLQNAQILQTDFENIFALANANDFMFLDPPYDCIFHDYGNMTTNFGEDEHRRLASAIQNVNCRILMVIGRTPLTEELYAGHIVSEYPVRYSVNIRNRFDTDTTHIVVTNY